MKQYCDGGEEFPGPFVAWASTLPASRSTSNGPACIRTAMRAVGEGKTAILNVVLSR